MTAQAQDAHGSGAGKQESVWVDEDPAQPGHVRLHIHVGGHELLTISFAAAEADELGQTLRQEAAKASQRLT